MGKLNLQNLDPVKKGSPEAKARGKQGGINSGKAKREKKLLSQIYAEFLANQHNVSSLQGKKKITGSALCTEVISAVLTRKDSASVSLLKEIREGTEGSKVDLTGSVNMVYADKQDKNL